MTSDALKYAWQFVLLVLLQVLIFNNLNLGGYVNPFPYIYLILVLPISMGRIQLLLVGFLLGLSVDVFSDTGGIHAAATTLIAFYRPLYLKAQSPREGYEMAAVPHLKVFGLTWFIPYAVLLVLLHHTVLFYLEVFRFSEFFHTLLKTVLSSLLTLFFILLAEYLFVGSNKRR
ncbi:MAG: rod shape-determining protein MreD [Flavobacteriales bacterium]|nr:rod shape-determining protein MreD [Flavobacteriales bacterium]